VEEREVRDEAEAEAVLLFEAKRVLKPPAAASSEQLRNCSRASFFLVPFSFCAHRKKKYTPHRKKKYTRKTEKEQS
jgi:hypothetical protein